MCTKLEIRGSQEPGVWLIHQISCSVYAYTQTAYISSTLPAQSKFTCVWSFKRRWLKNRKSCTWKPPAQVRTSAKRLQGRNLGAQINSLDLGTLPSAISVLHCILRTSARCNYDTEAGHVLSTCKSRNLTFSWARSHISTDLQINFRHRSCTAHFDCHWLG